MDCEFIAKECPVDILPNAVADTGGGALSKGNKFVEGSGQVDVQNVLKPSSDSYMDSSPLLAISIIIYPDSWLQDCVDFRYILREGC
ncbi:hypothetical protein SUGI_0907300 [Cryptomeria japonica]|nr:hypothetical protein SUGI_0907300 [Cryptomeria japonica]